MTLHANAAYENRQRGGEDFYKWKLVEYERLRELRNAISGRKGRPSSQELLELYFNKPVEEAFKRELFMSLEDQLSFLRKEAADNLPQNLDLFKDNSKLALEIETKAGRDPKLLKILNNWTS